jgi:plasmid maintenance system antidote protein VapI
MKKVSDLRKEINDILARPQPWGPMMADRIKKALHESVDTINALLEIIDENSKDLKLFYGIRKDTKLDRNAEIVKMWQHGAKQSVLAEQYGLTRQRVNTIIKRSGIKENHNATHSP